MFAILHALAMLVANQFKSRSRLEAENLFLRHQLTICFAAGTCGSRKFMRRSDELVSHPSNEGER
jgi:hypothetical protein